MVRSPDDGEKRKVNATAYRNYLNRDGPRALGSKEIPQVTKIIKKQGILQRFAECVCLFRVQITAWRAACSC